ncbi:MAG: alkaline phosphatase, partial [Thermomicrobiaceae bacterium]|nr:alkaline phosphatase [Thermomicrobiaceae bacterium]
TGAAGYYTYFGAAASPLDANCTSGCKGYYSFDLPNRWHVVILNVQCSKVGGCGSGTPQEVWLRNDLAAHQGWHIIAAWHQPRWSSGYGGDIKNSATFWKDLYNAHADIVLTGHSHNYERWALMDPNGTPDPNGIREFVVGTGGNNHTALSCGKPGQPACRPTSEARDDTTFGVLKLTLHEHSYDWVFIPDTQAGNGSFTDSGSQPTHS